MLCAECFWAFCTCKGHLEGQQSLIVLWLTGARPLFPAGRPAFPGFPGQVAPGGGYPMQYPAGMSGFQSAAVMGAYGMGGPYAYNPYANMMMGGYGFHPYAYGPQYAGQAAAIAAAAAAQQQQQQQQQQAGGGYSPAAGQASGVNAAAAPSIQAAGPAPRVGTLPRSQAGVGPAQQPHTQQQTRLQQSGAGGRAGAPPSGLSPGMLSGSALDPSTFYPASMHSMLDPQLGSTRRLATSTLASQGPERSHDHLSLILHSSSQEDLHHAAGSLYLSAVWGGGIHEQSLQHIPAHGMLFLMSGKPAVCSCTEIRADKAINANNS